MMWRIAAGGVLSGVVGVILSELGFKGKRIFTAVCFTLLISIALSGAGDMLGSILGFAEGAGVGRIAKVAVKVVGVGYVFGFTSDICEELGERGVASALSAAARIEILLLVFPYFMEICNIGVKAFT